MEETVEYELLLPFEFEARMTACPLAYVALGALEWHGEHMAVGNDTLKAHAMCCEAARRGGGIVFPPLYYGIPEMVKFGQAYRYSANFPVSEPFLFGLLTTTLQGLEQAGFKAAILITGHTPDEQSALVRKVAQAYTGQMKVYGTDDMEWANDLDYTSDHAAHWETSVLWYVRPDLVDIHRLPKDPSQKLEGIYGKDPRQYASRELGKQALLAVARDLAALGKRLLNESQ